jgi:hypothetical protein
MEMMQEASLAEPTNKSNMHRKIPLAIMATTDMILDMILAMIAVTVW